MVYNLKNYIKDFDPNNIKVGDVIITKSNGTINVEKIETHGWDFNFGDLIWFSDDTYSLNSMDLLKRNARNLATQ